MDCHDDEADGVDTHIFCKDDFETGERLANYLNGEQGHCLIEALQIDPEKPFFAAFMQEGAAVEGELSLELLYYDQAKGLFAADGQPLRCEVGDISGDRIELIAVTDTYN